MATAKPRLESLEDRNLLSGSTLPAMAVASPQAGPSDNALLSYVSSMIQQRVQLFANIEQFAIGEYQIISQEIAQAAYSLQQQVGGFFGVNPTPRNPTQNTAATQLNNDWGAGRGNSSGAGRGTGSMASTHNTANQSVSTTQQQSGGGTGSGSSASSVHANPASTGTIKAQAMSGSAQPLDSGSVGSGVSGSGTGSVGTGTGSYGYANVGGKVWLDNNGDGSQDNYEVGYSGITVDLYAVNGSQWTLEGSTTTASDGSYLFQNVRVVGYPEPYLVHVELSGSSPYQPSFSATYHTSDNMINNKGNSSIFDLAIGGWRKIKAGLLAMTVTTTADDPNAPIPNQITLRDAIQTGNNGGGPLGLNVITFFDFTKNQPLSGTIALQKALDPINRSYAVSGPGAGVLTVQGGGVNNPFRIFAVNAGVTSIISGLTIENGAIRGIGGGVLNQGNLTLENDIITQNQASVAGGGIENDTGAELNLISAIIAYNSATAGGGGGVSNSGTLSISQNSWIEYNRSAGGGAGISNSGTITATDGTTQIIFNTDSSPSGGGGGVENGRGSKFKMQGGAISGNTSSVPTTGEGGGLFNAEATATLTNVAILGDQARQGGGIYMDTGKLTLKNDTLSLDAIGVPDLANLGGGMFIKAGTVNMSKGGITKCTATSSGANGATGGGGGVYVSGGSLTLTGVNILSNTSFFNGGGIATPVGRGVTASVKVSGGTIDNNKANGNSGGGIFVGAGTLTLSNNVNVTSNRASNQGGGLYLGGNSVTTFNGATVSGNTALNAARGNGVYEQIGAAVFPQPPNLTDKDDAGGPVKGP